jgi:hypothetical protein
MKINRDNYEAYFLDYHEGQLSSEMVQEVLLFVKQNPDLKQVFEEFEPVTLIADSDIVFEKKSTLKKNQVFATSKVNELNYEEYLIGETEGILTADELASLDEFISINPHLEKDRRLFSLMHLSVDENIIYEAKEALKQKAIPVGLIDADTFETFMARQIEGDLSHDENLMLAEFLNYNPHLERDQKLYTHTILSAEKDIVFENKASLKHSVIPMRRIVYYALSAAASLALLFSVYFLLDRNDIPQNIALQDPAKNAAEINAPKQDAAIPQNQVAIKTNQPETNTTAITNQAQPGSTNDLTENNTNVTVIPLLKADIARNTIETLQSRSVKEISTRSFVDPQFTFIRTSQMYMNQHLEFYYNLKLAEQIQYAQVNSKDKNPGRTILNAASGKADDLFALNRTSAQHEDKKNLSLWTFAELGVQTFNTITSSELELKLQKDEEGQVVSYGIASGLVDFEREVKK